MHPVPLRFVPAVAMCLVLHAASVCAGQERSVPALVAALRAGDPLIRARAACDLRELGDRAAEAIPALIVLMDDPTPIGSDICENSRNWGGGEADQTSPGKLAAAALVALGSRSVVPVLAALQSPVWVARRNAAWALGALRDPRAIPPLIESLKDGEAAVREQAAWALGALRERSAVPALVKALQDAEPRVRRQTAWALGALRDRTAVTPLIGLLTDNTAGVRRQAAWALGALGDPRALQSAAVRAERRRCVGAPPGGVGDWGGR